MARSKRRRPRRYGKYTARQRGEVAADVARLGVNGAAKKHSIPASTVSRWAKKYGKKREKDSVSADKAAPTAVMQADGQGDDSAGPTIFKPPCFGADGSRLRHGCARRPHTRAG